MEMMRLSSNCCAAEALLIDYEFSTGRLKTVRCILGWVAPVER